MVVTGINTELEFTITFHTPFRVGASYGESGVDLTLDRDEPVGADHLKGLMRFAAHDVLRLDDSLIAAVYGSTATPSPWCWTAAVPTEEWKAPELRNRVAIDPATHAVTGFTGCNDFS